MSEVSLRGEGAIWGMDPAESEGYAAGTAPIYGCCHGRALPRPKSPGVAGEDLEVTVTFGDCFIY